jgi:hypothetical protein
MPFTALSNGDETAIVLFTASGSSFPAGLYTLEGKLDRDRWADTGTPDPEQHYHDEVTLTLTW